MKKFVKLFIVLCFAIQIVGCASKPTPTGPVQSPSDRIDDVEQRNQDLFKELN